MKALYRALMAIVWGTMMWYLAGFGGDLATSESLLAPFVAVLEVQTALINEMIDALGMILPYPTGVMVPVVLGWLFWTHVVRVIDPTAALPEIDVETASDDRDRDDRDDSGGDVDRDELHEPPGPADRYVDGEISLIELEQEIERDLLEQADDLDADQEESDGAQEESDAETDTSRERERAIGPVKKPEIGGIERNRHDSQNRE